MGIIGASQIFLTNTQWADSFYRGYFAFWSVACTHVQHMAFPHGSRIIKEVGLWLEGRWMVFWPGDINEYVTAWLCSMLLLYVCIICMKQQRIITLLFQLIVLVLQPAVHCFGSVLTGLSEVVSCISKLSALHQAVKHVLYRSAFKNGNIYGDGSKSCGWPGTQPSSCQFT